MKFGRYLGLSAFAAVALLLNVSQSQAASLVVPGSLTVGDKTFNFLSFTNTTSPNPGSSPITPGQITLTPLPGPPIGFELSAGFAAVPNSINTNDVLLKYTVTDTGTPITAVTLTTNGSMTGTGFAEVVEQVFTNNNGQQGTFLGQISVLGGGTSTLSLGAGFTSLFITKDIQYDVLGSVGTASFSLIDQTFTQAVPEPASVVMMGLGVAGVLGVARFRRKAVVA